MNLSFLFLYAIIIACGLISYKGFINRAFFRRYAFEVDAILVRREYIRMLSSGFLHVNWLHLLVNMYTLFAFGKPLLSTMGVVPFLVIYMGSLVAGNLLALLIQKHRSDYTAVGASGAVCGVIFASIAIFPTMDVSLFILPIFVPGWLFGVLFIAFSIYGIRNKVGNIGHEAHLGGALGGMLLALVFRPDALSDNLIPILVISLPVTAFIIFLIYKPHALLIDSFTEPAKKKNYTLDDRYNDEKINRQKEIDTILEKIGQKGVESLSKKEKEKLDAYSKR